MSDRAKTVDDLTYEWPTNLDQYETRVFLGLTAVEAIAGVMAFLVPLTLLPTVTGFLLALAGAVAVLLSIKKIDALGGLSLPAYGIARWLARRKSQGIELPLIIGGHTGAIGVEDWEGATLMILEEGR